MKRIQFKLTAVISEYVAIDYEDYRKGIVKTDKDSLINSGLIDMIRTEEADELAEVLKEHLKNWDLEFTDISDGEVCFSDLSEVELSKLMEV